MIALLVLTVVLCGSASTLEYCRCLVQSLSPSTGPEASVGEGPSVVSHSPGSPEGFQTEK